MPRPQRAEGPRPFRRGAVPGAPRIPSCDAVRASWAGDEALPRNRLLRGFAQTPERSNHEDPCSRRSHRWWRRRSRHPLPPREEGVVRRGARGTPGADVRVDLARGGAAAAVQHELLRRPDPQVLGGAVPHARGGDRAERGLEARRQHPARDEPRPDGRVPPVRGGGPHHRSGRRLPDPRGGQGDLAAVQHRRTGGSDSPSRRRLRAAGGPDPGAGDRRAHPRCADPPQHHRDRNLPHRERRVVRADRQGRHRLRARGERDGKLRPAHRGDGGPRRAGDSRAAPVHRDRAAPGDSGPTRGGAARRWGCCASPTARGTCARSGAG